MFETIENYRTFKEINENHDMICIEAVKAIDIPRIKRMNEEQYKYLTRFYLEGDMFFSSDDFDTKEEALKFRNEIMGWKNGNS